MADIFLSYAEEDRPKARMLAKRFEEQGWSVFWDRKIRSGDTWREVIARELTVARAVVVAWSGASVGSSWVQEEADDARQRGILVPVKIEPIEIPIGFRSVQAADLSDWEGTGGGDGAQLEGLFADLAHLLRQLTDESRDTEGDGASTIAESRKSRSRRLAPPTVLRWVARLAGALVGTAVGFLVGGSLGQLLVGGSAQDFHYLITSGMIAGGIAGLVAVFYWQRRRAGRELR